MLTNDVTSWETAGVLLQKWPQILWQKSLSPQKLIKICVNLQTALLNEVLTAVWWYLVVEKMQYLWETSLSISKTCDHCQPHPTSGLTRKDLIKWKMFRKSSSAWSRDCRAAAGVYLSIKSSRSRQMRSANSFAAFKQLALTKASWKTVFAWGKLFSTRLVLYS